MASGPGAESPGRSEEFAQRVQLSAMPHLLEFHTPHCGSCRRMKRVLQEVADRYIDEVKVVRIYTEHTLELIKQYRVVANSPTYDEQLALMKEYEGLGGSKPVPGGGKNVLRLLPGRK